MDILTFKQFLTEVKATNRVSIQHIETLPPKKFIQLVNYLYDKYKGVLDRQEIHITEKIDGSSIRFGVNKEGKPFIESSYSGPIFNDGGYTEYVKSRGYEPNKISKGFDNILKSIKTDKKLLSVLKKYSKPNGVKIIGELLYMPFGVQTDEDKVKFVKISYDKKHLGSEWTIIPFSVVDDDGNAHEQADKVLNDLYRISSDKRKYVPPKINIDTDIDISAELSDIKSNIIDKYENIESLIVSRKKADKELKEKLKAELAEWQKQLSKKIIKYVEQGLFGKDFEGVVIKLSDGTMLKVVTDTFKASELNDLTK